jgi:hypothetical protein
MKTYKSLISFLIIFGFAGTALVSCGNETTGISDLAEVAVISGTHEGFGFKVTVNHNRTTAKLVWDDGTQGFSAKRNKSPNPMPRCPCDIFDGPDGRRLTLDIDLQNGGYRAVRYERKGWAPVNPVIVTGTHEGYGFAVSVTGTQAQLTWDDGTQGFTATKDSNPNPAPRCPCDVFNGPEGRQLVLELDLVSGGYRNAIYYRNGL